MIETKKGLAMAEGGGQKDGRKPHCEAGTMPKRVVVWFRSPLVTPAMHIASLEAFDAVFCLAQSFQLKHGQFMEQVSEVEAFLGLNAINPFCNPVDREGPDVRRVVACRGIGPGMGPDVESPPPAFITPSMVHVLFRRHVEEQEEIFLRVAQVNGVHSGFHGFVSLMLLLLAIQRAMPIIRSLTFACTLMVHLPNRPLRGRCLSEEPHLCVCTLGVPEALLICRHKTLPQKKLELLLVAVLS